MSLADKLQARRFTPEFLGYEVTEEGWLLAAPCACGECRDGQSGALGRDWGQGHFACDPVTDELLAAEAAGLIEAVYTDGSWRWFPNQDTTDHGIALAVLHSLYDLRKKVFLFLRKETGSRNCARLSNSHPHRHAGWEKGEKTMAGKQGAFEQLVAEIEKLLPAEGGWYLENGELVIHTTVSRDPSRNRNGGEYDFYTCFSLQGDGVLVYDTTSCELHVNGMGQHYGEIIPCIVGAEGLRRIAASIGLRATCKKFLKKQATFSQLREAVQATVPAEVQ